MCKIWGIRRSDVWVSEDKLQPCAFLACKLFPTERNYDVGDRELLAIKVALEECWRMLMPMMMPVLFTPRMFPTPRAATFASPIPVKHICGFCDRFSTFWGWHGHSHCGWLFFLRWLDSFHCRNCHLLKRWQNCADSRFSAQFLEAFCKLLVATVSTSSGYHPESNGHTERLNQGGFKVYGLSEFLFLV